MDAYRQQEDSRARLTRPAGLAVWACAFGLMALLDGHVDLASQALMLVLGSALAALCWPASASLAACMLAVLAFNIAFVPPRGTLHVDLRQHALLLLTMLSVSWIVTLLVARQRRLAEQATLHARLSEDLRAFADRLRESSDLQTQARDLIDALRWLGGGEAALLLRVAPADADGQGYEERWIGQLDRDQRAGLQLCAAEMRALGPGSGRHEEQPAWYLPLRGKSSCQGAALLPLPATANVPMELRDHAQAICDQLGLALERNAALGMAAAARDTAQGEALRNTVLSAIAHDHRTPLATILGAATALHDQADRLDPTQVRGLAARIADESRQLSRLTENMLQLARLAASADSLQRDWESVEELLGSVPRRLRQRGIQCSLQVQLQPGLPLLYCDPLLIVQLLDNLVDNALRHAGPALPIELQAQREGDQLLIAVRDRGPGVAVEQRHRIFESFQRGDTAGAADRRSDDGRRGAGIGLAVGLAIARAHGGDLRYRPRQGGGSSFELVLPLREQPAPAQESSA